VRERLELINAKKLEHDEAQKEAATLIKTERLALSVANAVLGDDKITDAAGVTEQDQNDQVVVRGKTAQEWAIRREEVYAKNLALFEKLTGSDVEWTNAQKIHAVSRKENWEILKNEADEESFEIVDKDEDEDWEML